MQSSGDMIGASVALKGTPVGLGVATMFGFPIPEILQWLTLIWLLVLFASHDWGTCGRRNRERLRRVGARFRRNG
jgi:hypothetical protein